MAEMLIKGTGDYEGMDIDKLQGSSTLCVNGVSYRKFDCSKRRPGRDERAGPLSVRRKWVEVISRYGVAICS